METSALIALLQDDKHGQTAHIKINVEQHEDGSWARIEGSEESLTRLNALITRAIIDGGVQINSDDKLAVRVWHSHREFK